jgi:hypothetical protein
VSRPLSIPSVRAHTECACPYRVCVPMRLMCKEQLAAIAHPLPLFPFGEQMPPEAQEQFDEFPSEEDTLVAHFRTRHMEYHLGSNPWTPSGKLSYRDSSDEDEEQDLVKERFGRSGVEVARVMTHVTALCLSRGIAPPGGWPLQYSDGLFDFVRQAVEGWARPAGR